MFTTPADAPSLMSWNNGTSTWVDTAMQNCVTNSPGVQMRCRTGRFNTDFLAGLGSFPSPAPYVSANYCNSLNAHGHTDWYLPAQDELNVLWINRMAIGGFNVTGIFLHSFYWSSSEEYSINARIQRFSDGSQLGYSKNNTVKVRCVRRVP
ncbi:MAG: DUF1566 domain-containing protein [Alphaproteobacteria bacterium]